MNNLPSILKNLNNPANKDILVYEYEISVYVSKINDLNSAIDRMGIDFVGMNLGDFTRSNFYMTEENRQKFEKIADSLVKSGFMSGWKFTRTMSASEFSKMFAEYYQKTMAMAKNFLPKK